MAAGHVGAHGLDEHALEVVYNLLGGEHVNERKVACLECEGGLEVELDLAPVGELAERAGLRLHLHVDLDRKASHAERVDDGVEAN